jgi:hypothetical protein
MIMACKDCDQTIECSDGPGLLRAKWNYIDLTGDENDPANGWRCPKCVEGWQIIVDEQQGKLQS